VYGSGEQTRCFTHVLDVVPALRNLMKTKSAQGLVVNIGCDEEISINELAKRVQEKVNPKVEIVTLPYEKVMGRDFEDMEARRPDLSRASQLIGYHPTKTLDTIIDDVHKYVRGEWKPEM